MSPFTAWFHRLFPRLWPGPAPIKPPAPIPVVLPFPAPPWVPPLDGPGDPLVSLNRVRVARNLPRLTWDADLQAVSAANDAAEMIRHQEGHFVFPANGRWQGQVAAEGCKTADAAVVQWLGSARHFAIITDPIYTRCGMAGDINSQFWTATFST